MNHLIIMGVSGTGKTTVAQLVQEQTGRVYAEADSFHPQANIDKMHAGTPLTDEDRWPWLRSLAQWMSEQHDAGLCTVLTCSSLKREYRDLLRTAEGNVYFAHLSGDPELISERLNSRSGHFMPSSLLPSQLATLEPLEADEAGAEYPIDGNPQQIVATILDSLPAGTPAC